MSARIATAEVGSGAPIVLLHGVGTNRSIWYHAAPLVAAGGDGAEPRRVITPDLPGFGESPPAGPGFDLEQVADHLAEGLEGETDGPFDLLGHSLGGAIATVLAARRPDLVRRLVLMAPAGFTPGPQPLGLLAGMAAQGLVPVRRGVGRRVAGSAAMRRVLLFGSVGNGSRLSPQDARLMLEASRGARRMRQAIAAVVRADLRPVLAGVEMPFGLIWGEQDRMVDFAGFGGFTDRHPDAPARTLPDCGHVPQLEAPAEFAGALDDVLSDLAPARQG